MKRNGKNIIAILLALLLAVALIGTAAAETISPLPPRFSMDDLEDRYITTDIEYKGNGQATLTLYDTERFDAEAVRALQAGDVIVTEGEEIVIESVTADGPDLIFNQGTELEMRLCDDGKGAYERTVENDMNTQVMVGTIDFEVLPYIVMLDWVDAKTGEPLDELAVRDGEDLLNLLEADDGPSFAVKNVCTLFDNNNQPRLIWRYYSPAQ